MSQYNRKGRYERVIGFILLLCALFCIGYYVIGGVYAGFGASFMWMWLLAGIFFLILLGVGVICRQRGIEIHLPLYLRKMVQIGLLCFALLFVLVEAFIVGSMWKKGEPDLDYVVVLGAQVKQTVPSKALRERLDAAKDYLQKNPETKAVLSGGMGTGELITEAKCMYEYLTEQGIAASRLLLEEKSTNTEENIRYSFAMMDKENPKVGIVTNNFHVFRGVAIAKKQGYQNSFGIAAQSRSVLQLNYMVREFLAVCKDKICGHI